MRPKKVTKDQTLSLRLSTALLDQLREKAQDSGVKLNPMIEAILKKVLADKEFTVEVEVLEDP